MTFLRQSRICFPPCSFGVVYLVLLWSPPRSMYTSMKLCVRGRPMWMQHFCLSCPVGVRHSAWISSVLLWTQLGFLPPHVLIRYFLLSSVLIFFSNSLSLSAGHTSSVLPRLVDVLYLSLYRQTPRVCSSLVLIRIIFTVFLFLLKFLIIEMGRKYVYNALVIQLNLVVAAAKLVGCVSKDCHCRLRRRALTIHTRIVSRTKRRVALHLLKPTGCIYVSVFSGSDWRID